MNIKTASAVLKLLKTAKADDPRVKLAMRWIRASLADDYDKMLRAQVLEGAAGVKIGSWWKQGQRGLDKARVWFAENGFDKVDPKWFDKQYSGMYGILEMAIMATAKGYGVSLEPHDIMNSALMGLRADPSKPGHRKEGPYYAGVDLSDKIKAGKETPRVVGGGKLKAYLGRRVSDTAKAKKINETMPEGLEGQELEVADTAAKEREASNVLMDIILINISDPLGKKIRNFMRKSWAGTSQEEAMNYWLDTVEQERRFPQGKEVAKAVGITPQTFSQRYWKKTWKQFFDALWSNQALIKQIQDRFEIEQTPWFAEKPDPEKVFAVRSRKASDILIRRIASRWLLTQKSLF